MSQQGFNVARCPYCMALDVRRSRFRWIDLPVVLLLRKVLRCGTCKGRFSSWLG